MTRPTLLEQYEAKLSAPRCRPFCNAADHVDGKPDRGFIRTQCGKCGTFIGYRPVAAAKQKAITHLTHHNCLKMIIPSET